MKKLILCLFVAITINSKAQITFNEAIGGPSTDQAISAEVTTDGGYIIVGWTKSFGAGDWDIYLVKTNSTGTIEWSKTYGGPGEEVDCFVHQTYDGGYIITARTTSFNVASADVYLIKTNVTGDIIWTKTVGGSSWDEGHSNFQTQDSGYVHVGFTQSFGAGNHECYLIRSDKNGSTLWTKSFGGAGVDNGHLVIQAIDGGYIFLGETNSFGAGGFDYYLVKTDTSGNFEWSKTYGGAGDDHGWDIKVTNDSCYILAGYTNSFGAGGNDVFLIKINRNGDIIWSRTYGNSLDETGLAIRQTIDGGFVVAGESSAIGSDSADVYIVKLDKDGIPEWASTFGGNGDDGSQSIQQTADKGYFISGYTNSFGQGDWDFYLIKTDSSGHTATCNLGRPEVLLSNVTNLTMVADPPTQVGTGGVTGTPITIVNSGGVAAFCSVYTSVENITSENEINIYPNPFTSQTTISFSSEQKNTTIKIMDVLGNEILKQVQNYGRSVTLDMSGYAKGIYFVQITTSAGSVNENVVNKKVVVQ